MTVVIGTRPELIKMAPVIETLRARPELFSTRVVFSGQHSDLLDQMARYFKITPDVNLRVMRGGQSLSRLTSRLLTGLEAELLAHRPALVLAQGDTTTVFAAALTAHYLQLPFAHVEAGLRSGDLNHPFPEEANRRVAGVLADLHFAPTQLARRRLLMAAAASPLLACGAPTAYSATPSPLTSPTWAKAMP